MVFIICIITVYSWICLKLSLVICIQIYLMTVCIQWVREKYVISETGLYMKFIDFSSTMPVTSIHVLVESTLWIINVWILSSYFQMCFVFLEFWINLPCCAFQNHKSQQLSQTKYDWPSKVKEDHDRDHLDNTIALTKPVNTSVLSSMCGMDLHIITTDGLCVVWTYPLCLYFVVVSAVSVTVWK